MRKLLSIDDEDDGLITLPPTPDECWGCPLADAAFGCGVDPRADDSVVGECDGAVLECVFADGQTCTSRTCTYDLQGEECTLADCECACGALAADGESLGALADCTRPTDADGAPIYDSGASGAQVSDAESIGGDLRARQPKTSAAPRMLTSRALLALALAAPALGITPAAPSALAALVSVAALLPAPVAGWFWDSPSAGGGAVDIEDAERAGDVLLRKRWQPTAEPTPPPASECEGNVLRKQCEESGNAYAVFTPYPEGYNVTEDGECADTQPCRYECTAECAVSAFIKEIGDGERVIEYFVTGAADCTERLRGLSFDAVSLLGYDEHYSHYRPRQKECAVCAGDLLCGYVAPHDPAEHRFELPFEDDDTEDSFLDPEDDDTSDRDFSQSHLADHGHDHEHGCVLKDDSKCAHRHEKRVLLPLNGGFRGTAVHVPADHDIEVRDVHIFGHSHRYHCVVECTLPLPVPVCTREKDDSSSSSSSSSDDCDDCDASSDGHSGYSAYHYEYAAGLEPEPAPTETPAAAGGSALGGLGPEVLSVAPTSAGGGGAEYGECETLAEQWLTDNGGSVESARAAALAWLNVAEEHASALARCAPDTYTDDQRTLDVALPSNAESDASCDYTQCAAALGDASVLTGGVPPSSAAQYAARAAELVDGAYAYYSESRYTQARQSACCAERVYANLLEINACGADHCAVKHIYPDESAGAEFDALSGSRKRLLGLDDRDAPYRIAAPHRREQQRAAGERVLAFEECGAVDGRYVPDNDFNDAVFGVSAGSAVSLRDGAWLSSTVHVRPLALGTLHDHALELRFADAGLPRGARVRLVRLGVAASAECYTVNSAETETLECPSTSVVRLFRSLRAALPQHEAADAPYVNTLAAQPLAHSAHRATLFIDIPLGHRSAPTLALAFELRDRKTNCVVQTKHFEAERALRGAGVLAPAPFAYPLEGVPAYINATQVPHGGVCVGGDNARARCDELQECAGGYCEMHGPDRYHCVDAPLAGVNRDALCSRASQCPYGRCYAHEDAPGEHGAYPALAEYLESGGRRARDWFAQRAPEAASATTYYDRAAHDN